jgi:hypothetical protein
MRQTFQMWAGQFPISYLDTMIHHWRLMLAERKLVEKTLQKRLSSWKIKLLFLSEILVLLNSILINMVLYIISFVQLPKVFLHKLDYF